MSDGQAVLPDWFRIQGLEAGLVFLKDYAGVLFVVQVMTGPRWEEARLSLAEAHRLRDWLNEHLPDRFPSGEQPPVPHDPV